MSFISPIRHLGMLHFVVHPNLIDIYNPNAPYAQATLSKIDGGIKLFVRKGAPLHFRNEVDKYLDQLKTILILGG